MKQNTTTPTDVGRADALVRFVSIVTTVALIATFAVYVLSAAAVTFVAPMAALGGAQ